MTTKPDVVDQIISLRRDGWTHQDIATKFEVGYNTVRDILRRAAKKGKLGFKPVLPGFEVTRVTTREADGSSVVQRPEQPEGELKLPDGHILERTSIKHGDSWYKTKLSQSAQTRDDLIEIFQEYRGKSVWVPPPVPMPEEDLVTVLPTSDLHMGLLAWGRQTGKAWDLKIARQEILSSAATLIACTPRSKIGILVDLGDFTHNNSQSNVTPESKHPLDVDGRFPKIGKEAMRLRVDLIHMALEKFDSVIYRGLPGNHDPDTAQLISIAMALLFENNPRVTIDDDPSDFWFYEHGRCMFCANHGHKVKPSRLPGLMAARQKAMWGRTDFKQAWSGHIHHTTAGEELGARWETLRTPAAADAFSNQYGYTAGRELTAWTYHKERGLIMKQVAELL